MGSAAFRIRRATLDDLPTLRPLWESMRFDPAGLERRLTEFQVAEGADGQMAGGVGFQIAGRHANIHSEAFFDFAIAEAVRPLLWERLQALALNHGIARLWTREPAPFWRQAGLSAAPPEALKKLPEAWNQPPHADWLTLALKDEDTIVSMEKELALFMESEKERTSQAFKQAKTLKTAATIVAILFALFVIAALVVLFQKNPGILAPRR